MQSDTQRQSIPDRRMVIDDQDFLGRAQFCHGNSLSSGCNATHLTEVPPTLRRSICNVPPTNIQSADGRATTRGGARLAATDFSEISRNAVLQGLLVANSAAAEFHLLHVVDSKDVPEEIISRIPKGSSLKQEINEEALARMDAFVDTLAVDRASVQVHQSWGTPWQEIRRAAKFQAADLVVIGTVGRNGIKGLLLGNTAEKTLSTCDCSILTVRPDNFISPIAPVTWELHPVQKSEKS